MKGFIFFCLVMIIGFFVFVPWLLIVIPMIGIKTFVIVVILLIIGFLTEYLMKKN
ncbi:hypothetical protein MUN88_09680 [Gracilibacillus caseinilyticus]|uniref:Uncharacterized protein n=1 Tax=Gracilibacillus caseinilyticus TaxID=2932256 RepID=A0ABY4F1E6_9BACI|nr:hypothetical protein [Gracilibacillus caseinilyticus]UOQ50299.1 hypothetical protein MUN88_09680 [Gracilibacillus caseinilyticus]